MLQLQHACVHSATVVLFLVYSQCFHCIRATLEHSSLYVLPPADLPYQISFVYIDQF